MILSTLQLIEVESGDSSGKARDRRPWTDALISAKNTEIRQIELFVVRLAHGPPAESVRLERKSTAFYNGTLLLIGLFHRFYF